MIPDETIVCVECGGTCHLLTQWPPDDPPVPGDIAAYRCADCVDRFDIVLEEDEGEPD
jgi:DNA-directed RNA polymerase subunit RPC12/RpoP